MADGARADVMAEELKKGNLPNIARHLIEKGSFLEAVTSFPSTTGPAYLPFLTGCLPGTCNIPGIRWLDKAKYGAGWSFDRYRSYVGLESFWLARDIGPHIQTIFEIVPHSFSIFNPIARGARGPRNVTRLSRIWHWYYAHLTDRWTFTDDAALVKLKATLKKRPTFLFAVFPGIDEYSHLTHPHHEKVLDRYHWLDGAIGTIVSDFKDAGTWDETALFLVSDHGLSATHTHFCLNTFLEKRGITPFFYPLIFNKRGRSSATMVSGNAMAHVYFKNRDGWTRETVRRELEVIAPGLIDELLQEEAVDIVAVRNEGGGVQIFSRRGEAKIMLDGAKLHYEITGSDPFGYAHLPDDLYPQSCLQATFETEYPDAPFQIAHLFTAPRTGDIVISATPGFDLRLKYENPEHHGSHGSIHRSHMHVPLITNLKFKTGPVRTVDVFPTILKLLGYDIPGHIDGMPLCT